jgi:surface polysaccharide O-acyltransferase-like enzyme
MNPLPVSLQSRFFERIDVLRFPLIVGVVFIHAYQISAVPTSEVLNIEECNLLFNFIRNFISQGVARISVPMFFLISSILFFRNLKFTLSGFASKIHARVQTLLLPFLFWNILTFVLFLILQFFPITQVFFSGSVPKIANLTVWDNFSLILGIGRTPISYQFWFIRDLMLLICVAPFLFLIAQHAYKLPLLILIIFWGLDLEWPLYAPSTEAALFFFIGAVISVKNIDLFKCDKFGDFAIFGYIFFAFMDTIFFGKYLGPYLHKIAICVGMVALLYLTALVVQIESLKYSLIRLSRSSFFIYATHEPILTIVKKVTFKIITPNNSILLLTLYFLIPLTVLVFLLQLNKFFIRFFPNLTKIISGGRD